MEKRQNHLESILIFRLLDILYEQLQVKVQKWLTGFFFVSIMQLYVCVHNK